MKSMPPSVKPEGNLILQKFFAEKEATPPSPATCESIQYCLSW